MFDEILNMVLDNLIQGVIVTDNNYCILYKNEFASRLIANHLIHENGLSDWLRMTHQKSNHQLEDSINSGARSLINQESSGLVVISKSVKTTDTDVILFQINVNKEAFHYDNSHKVKTDFISNISHEFRTPLNAILGYAEILINDALDENQLIRLNIIKENSNNLLTLLNDLLNLSKLESGLMNVVADDTDIILLLDELFDIFKHQINNKGLQFDVHFNKIMGIRLKIDEIMLRQILFNLIGNAIKFTDEGSIIVAVNLKNIKKDKLDLEIQITDTGIGISDDYQEHLYEIFSQENEKNSKSFGGAGLGLAIISKFVKKLNGTLSFESQVGKGTSFKIIFHNLNYQADGEPDRTNFHESPAVSLRGIKTILVVDNIRFTRDKIRRMLSNYNLNYFETDKAESAIILASEIKPDIILMNIRMPGMNGIEAGRHIKLNKNTRNIPIIAMSSVDSGLKTDEEKKIFVDIIKKPLNSDVLKSTIQRIDKKLKII